MSDNAVPVLGATSTCRTCNKPITYKVVDRGGGFLPRTTWSDGHRVDEHICYSAIDYQHEPPRGVCRRCRCTNDRECDGGCSWAYPDICTACLDHYELDKAERNQITPTPKENTHG